ncbi:MAG: hypothetical protein J2O49_10880 [Sciscionella sp.]|nr:hypothetical protein [Sciscionella sp.]
MTVAAPVRTVADAMLRHPTVHPADLTIGNARAAFDASPKTHLLLLLRAGVLVSTVVRADVDGAADSTLAAEVGTLDGRTITPDTPLTPTHALMRRRGMRRLAVVDESMRLLGLLCLKQSLAGFCTDDGVAAMRRARAGR